MVVRGSGDARLLLGEDVGRPRVHVVVDQGDLAPCPLHERDQVPERAVGLALEEGLPARRLVRPHVVEDALEALVGRTLQATQPARSP